MKLLFRPPLDLGDKDEEKMKKILYNFERLSKTFTEAEDLEKFTKTFLSHTKIYSFKELAAFSDCDSLSTGSKIISSIEGDYTGGLFATAGVMKRINIYNLNNIIERKNENTTKNFPILQMQCDAKISCLSWNPFHENKLCSADYEGNLNLYDTTEGKIVNSWTEHEKRCWSVDTSVLDPQKFVSGSDDCKVKIWHQKSSKSCLTIDLKANVCSVRFSPKDSNLLAVGSADHRVLLFDMRKPSIPIFNNKEHSKSVSYVRFTESGSSIISASTDSTLRLWSQNKTMSWKSERIMYGHLNERNFVGLSNVNSGLIATGSEDNSVVLYEENLEYPVLKYPFKTACPLTGTTMSDESGTFVSSVSWANRPDSEGNSVLLLSNSTGNIRVISIIQE